MAYANLDYLSGKVNLQNQASSYRIIIDYLKLILCIR